MNKSTLIVSAIILAFLGLVGYSLYKKSADSIDFSAYDRYNIIEASPSNGEIGDHFRGNPETAKMIIIEYADMSCNHCASQNSMVERLATDYEDDVVFVFRHFLLGGYPNSIAAAAATEAAGRQGHFFEMLNILFSNQATWYSIAQSEREATFSAYFELVAPDGDVAKFKEDMKDKTLIKKVDFDHNLGKLSNIKGTPAFFYNSEYLPGETTGSETEFRAFLDKTLAELK
jgi:protein-disulfide isomerase